LIINFNIQSRLHDEKYYHDIVAWKIETLNK
jgi:hypothetical protein